MVHLFGLDAMLLRWVKSGRRYRVPRHPLSGRYSLTYSTRYRSAVVIFAVTAAGFLVLGKAARDPWMTVAYYLIFGPLAALAAYALYDTFRFPKRASSSASPRLPSFPGSHHSRPLHHDC